MRRVIDKCSKLLRHLLNAKALFVAWQRYALNEVKNLDPSGALFDHSCTKITTIESRWVTVLFNTLKE